MKIFSKDDELIISDDLVLSSKKSQKDTIKKNLNWEPWLKNPDGDVVSFRLVLNAKEEKYGNLFLIVTFNSPITDESLLCSWFMAPEKLINGKQSKKDGAITKNLRKWFYEKTFVELPAEGEWGHIDASYDPWNSAGLIVCNYKPSFKNND